MKLLGPNKDLIIGVFTPGAEADKGSVYRVLETFSCKNFRFVFDRSLLKPVDTLVDKPIHLDMLKRDQIDLSPKKKAASFHRLVRNPEIDIIWCYNGPAGAIETVQHIDWDIVRAHRKPVIGFSDASAFLNAVTAKTGIPTFCAENLIGADPYDFNIEMLIKMLTGEKISLTSAFVKQNYGVSYDYKGKIDAVFPDLRASWSGHACGPLYGGNLTRLRELHDVGIVPDYNGAVLFLEDTGETARTIGFHLEALDNIGVFESISALLMGDFNSISESKPEQTYYGRNLDDIFDNLSSKMRKLGKLYISGLPSGHVRLGSDQPRRLFPMPIGETVSVRAFNNSDVIIDLS